MSPSSSIRHLTGPSVLAFLFLASSGAVVGADTTASMTAVDGAVDEISMELIMSHPDWLGNAPEDPHWSDDSRHVYFEQKRQGEEERDLFQVARDGDTPRRLTDDALGWVDVDGGDISGDRLFKTYVHRGDLYVKDLSNGEILQLTRTVAEERAPQFMPGNRHILYQREHQVFQRDLDSGLESQLVDLRLEKDPNDDAADSYLERQQVRLLGIIRQQEDEKDRQQLRRQEQAKADPSLPPMPWYLGDDIEILSSTVSPSGDWMALVVRSATADDGRNDEMPNYVTASGYVEHREVRPKVGTADGTSHRLWILDLTTRERHDIDLSILPGLDDDPLAELRQRAKAEAQQRLAEAAGKDGDGDAPGDAAAGQGDADDTAASKPRPVAFEEPMHWSPDGQRLLLQVHTYDNKDRWIGVIARNDLKLRSLHRLQQEGWINWYFNEYGWFPDSRSFYFLSEESGYSQLYRHDLEDGTTQRLTEGEFVVSDPQPTWDGRQIYFTANVEHPGIYEVYRVNVGGSPKMEQLTRLGGRSSFSLSPDGQHLAILQSTTTRPPELFIQPARVGAEARRVTQTVSDAFTALPWVAPQIVAVPSAHHDRPIYSRFYPPSSTRGEGAEGRPAVVFVHGAGYLQNSHQGWSGYFREFMFHTLLSQHGYAVLDMDYRASAGYGVAWREAIYRQMGTPELEDLEDGVNWLVQQHGVDAKRVGVYGGSYGGFLTMMALFKEPDLFAAGAALRPVTDWAHYNHPYTSNILNTPDVDPRAYERSSPIEFAEGLEHPLLICAPMQDDNVFFQDTVRLAQRLIELEKEDWEVAIFPIEPHGFRQPSSWLDEYRRIFKLFERHLQTSTH